ncbi:uncharacterized protein AB675_6439 [Cyphellophora attinorum]|uniref:AB hydrolase-1 domain-containing protein n=1 Tax=Cyphellophora attinorum TaxID=1664694 RepID=A0A0N0NQD2_9EURO|nr:uncharacterized protein AB675_6439 [Phialophora attinorum]KPI43771.1 hypothetical protein AB675_6439 [Phialophora attinorum]
MRLLATVLQLLALATPSFAHDQNCRNLTIPIQISARNGAFAVGPTQTDVDVTNFVLAGTQPGHNASASILKGYNTVNGTYNISATYCTPTGPSRNAIQILTHGIGFDRAYWDLPYNGYNYSYVISALSAGYATLTYDRLGIGCSSHGDPISEIQIFLEVEALAALTELVRTPYGLYDHGISENYQHVIHAGHSFGAIMTYALASTYPESSDAIILQGFSTDPTWIPFFMLGGEFVTVQSTPLSSQYPPGYLVSGSKSAVQTNFFAPNDFDPAILDYIVNVVGQPVAMGELLSIGGVGGPSGYKGPVLVITGERDVPFCGGDCYGPNKGNAPSVPAKAALAFGDPSKVDTGIVKGAGHGLSVSYSKGETYTRMLAWLGEVGQKLGWGGPSRVKRGVQ